MTIARTLQHLKNPVIGYGFSFTVIICTYFLRIWLIPFTGTGAPFVLFFAAVLMISLVAGARAGIFGVLLSIPLAAHTFVVRAGYPPFQAAIQSSLFLIDGIVVVYLTRLTKRRREEAEAINDKLYRANEEIRSSIARTREVIELAPDAFLQSDLEGRITDTNQAACQLLGYDRDELLTRTVFDIIPAEEAPRLKMVRTELLAPGRSDRTEWSLRRKDGTVVMVEMSSTILPTGRWQAFAHDITERRRREDERKIFTSFLENSSDFIGIADPEGRPLFLNSAGRRMVGLSPDFPIAEVRIEDCYPEELRAFASEVILKTMVECGVWTGETYLRHWRTEERIPVSDTHFMIRDTRGERILGMGTIIRDISDAKRIEAERERLFAMEKQARAKLESANAQLRESEEALRLSEEALRHAVNAREQVLGIVAHDLRNPLSNILQSLALPFPAAEKDQQRRMAIALRSARRMNHLIQDLLDVTHLESGKLIINGEPLSVSTLVLEAVDLESPLASAAGISVDADMESDLQDVWGDRNRLLQVFENLIGNAIKFTEKGGHIKVGAKAQAQTILFWVADTGCGIATEDLPHIFAPFWQATARARRLGAGLGLPITKGIVEAHCGQIWVESAVGRGSTFFFTIPRAITKSEISELPAAS